MGQRREFVSIGPNVRFGPLWAAHRDRSCPEADLELLVTTRALGMSVSTEPRCPPPPLLFLPPSSRRLAPSATAIGQAHASTSQIARWARTGSPPLECPQKPGRRPPRPPNRHGDRRHLKGVSAACSRTHSPTHVAYPQPGPAPQPRHPRILATPMPKHLQC